MVNETGQVEREIRDLEDQIETERDRNVSDNLKRITNDLKLLETEAKETQEKINALKKQPSQLPTAILDIDITNETVEHNSEDAELKRRIDLLGQKIDAGE